MREKTNSVLNFSLVVGVLSVFLLGEAQFVMNPALSALAGKYPEIPFSQITYLATIPSLIAVPMGIVSGMLTRRGVKYRTQILLSALIIVVSGVIPYWITNFTGWILCRVLFGIGFGVCVPMSGTLAQRSFEGEMAAKVQGWGATAQNLSGVVLQMLSGIVASRNVDYVWLVHFVLVIPFVLVALTLKEPDDRTSVETKPEIQNAGNQLPVMVYVKSVCFGLLFMLMYPFLTSISIILEQEGIGTAALAGTINSAFTVGGMVAGVTFIFFLRALKKWCLPLMYLMMGIDLMGVYLAKSSAFLILLGVLTGIIVFTLWSGHITEFGQQVAPENMAMASGIFVGAANLFCFFSSPMVGIIGQFVNESPRTPLLVGSAGCLMLGTVYLIYTARSHS